MQHIHSLYNTFFSNFVRSKILENAENVLLLPAPYPAPLKIGHKWRDAVRRVCDGVLSVERVFSINSPCLTVSFFAPLIDYQTFISIVVFEREMKIKIIKKNKIYYCHPFLLKAMLFSWNRKSGKRSMLAGGEWWWRFLYYISVCFIEWGLTEKSRLFWSQKLF